MGDLQVTDPGVYEIPEDQYHRDPVPGGSLSSSGARRILPPSCPALFQHWRTHPGPRSKAMDFGTSAHKRLLGVGARIVVVDAEDWRTKDAQRQKREAHADGAVPLLLADYERTKAMERVLREHPGAGRLFRRGAGKVEQSLFWVDDEFGVWRRARLDLVIPGTASEPTKVCDYKTTQGVDIASMQKSMITYGYARQGAWYLDAVTALCDPSPAGVVFLLVFQMSDPPYLVRVAEPDQEAIGWGRVQNRKAIEVYRDCVKNNQWPGWSDEVVPLANPRWAEYQLEAAWDNGDLSVSSKTEGVEW